jgi:hypothetical protein
MLGSEDDAQLVTAELHDRFAGSHGFTTARAKRLKNGATTQSLGFLAGHSLPARATTMSSVGMTRMKLVYRPKDQ